MKQFVLPGEHEPGDSVTLTGKDYHYLCVVRRYRPGAVVPALTPGGNPLTLTITGVADGRCHGRLEERLSESVGPASGELRSGAPEEPENGACESGAPELPATFSERLPEITLCQGALKGKKFDQVVRQATEAGVSRIMPLVTRHAVADPTGADREEKKLRRWRTIVREAVQQSGRREIPSVEPPRSLEEVLPVPERNARKIYFHEKATDAPPLSATLQLPSQAEEPAGEVWLLLGPEGGLSAEEVAKLRRAGWRPGFLGPQVLRSETAAVYALAAVQTVLREVDGWALQEPGEGR